METPRRKLLKTASVSLIAGGALTAASSPTAAGPEDRRIPAASANYEASNRGPSDVNWIVIHYTTRSYESAINTFKDPSSGVSANYVIGRDGHTTKMVDESDQAIHASDFNTHSVGIEHAFDTRYHDQFTEAQYEQSAEVIRHIAAEYDIPLSVYDGHTAPCLASGGIIAHTDAPRIEETGDCSLSNNTSCPGPFDFDTLTTYLDDGADQVFSDLPADHWHTTRSSPSTRMTSLPSEKSSHVLVFRQNGANHPLSRSAH
jgi:hypothetical protein